MRQGETKLEAVVANITTVKVDAQHEVGRARDGVFHRGGKGVPRSRRLSGGGLSARRADHFCCFLAFSPNCIGRLLEEPPGKRFAVSALARADGLGGRELRLVGARYPLDLIDMFLCER
jgi:hypothetical protein